MPYSDLTSHAQHTKKWSIMIWIGMLCCFYFNALHAFEEQKIPSLSDPAQVLRSSTFEHITQFLEHCANNRKLSLWVFVLKDNSGIALSTLAQEKLTKFENDYPQIKEKKRRAALFVNVDTHESWIILGEDFVKEKGLMEGIYAIHQEILYANLVNKQIDKALWEGTVALGMALEEFSQPAKALIFFQEVDEWLRDHHLMSLWSWCKWILSISASILFFRWMKILFYRPHWEETLDQELLAQLPENLSLYELTSMMMALKKDEELGSQ